MKKSRTPRNRKFPKKQIERLTSKIKQQGIIEIKSFLENLYNQQGSLRKLSSYLKNEMGIKLRPKDLIALMEHLGIERKNYKNKKPKTKNDIKFNGNKTDALYLWSFCIGDARIEATLSTLKIDVIGKLETVKCIIQTLFKNQPNKKLIKKTKTGYYYFTYSLPKKEFDFLLIDIDEIEQEITNFEEMVATLAGLIDSEGNIYIKIRKRKYKYKDKTLESTSIDHTIEITNCNTKLLKTIQKILKKYGITATIPPSKTGYGCSRLRINRRKDLKKIAPLLLKYMKHTEKIQKLKQMLNLITNKQ